MVTADGFRAGLLFGEPGVGKTSMVRAGLIPYLRDHGTVALMCEDLTSPAASFAQGLSGFGIQPNAQEVPIAFITRAVSNAVMGQQFVFIIDDVDLATGDDRVIGELAEMYSKIVSRSGGRARFLFVCASDRLNALGPLEKRTGSLFTPSTRYELPRIAPQAASQIFDRILALSGVAADPALADAVVQGIGRGRGLLAADLQLAAMAMRDLNVTSLAALQRVGGPTELDALWLQDVCKATGNERSAMRLVAELAAAGAGAHPAEMLIRRINLDASFAQQALGTLESRGVILRGDSGGVTWMLRHEVLTQRVKEITAPARAAARRAFDLLGAKTANKGRLSLKELRALRSEGIAPSSPEEAAILERSKRYYMMVAGAIAAVPLLLLVMIYISMRGRVFFDLDARAGSDHVLVRGGRSGLSPFGWMPGTGYGRVVADTGLTRSMVAPEMWKKIESHDLGSGRGAWDEQLTSLMNPQLAGLVDYATSGTDSTVENLKKAAKDPEDLAELLTALRPIARGGPAEVQAVEAAIATKLPAVARAAIEVAGAAAQRHDVYQQTLTQALISADPELRRIAFTAVRGLGERGRTLFKSALGKDPDSTARRELLVEVTAATTDDKPSVANAVAVLADPDSSQPQKDRAREEAKAGLVQDPAAAVAALVPLLANERAPQDARLNAIEMLRDVDPVPTGANLVEAAKGAFNSPSAKIRAAALPLYARVDALGVIAPLAAMLDDNKLETSLRVASALAWGEVAATNKDAAASALDRMLKDGNAEVRAAAATAGGKLGRLYQDKLYKMAKSEVYNVRIGAAEGLALSVVSGGNVGVGVDGIAQLWREKGRPRRDAVKIFSHLAKRKQPGIVIEYLGSAAKNTEDPALHPLGVEGLCNASLAGSPDARRALARSTDDVSADVRRMVMQCVADGPDPAKNGTAIAARLVRDPDNQIRADAARVLSLATSKSDGAADGRKIAAGISDALVQLLDDPDREVRVIGIRAIGGLGTAAPAAATQVLVRRFERADEGEKLAITRAAKQVGAAEIVALAISDSAPLVRVAAVDAALGSGLRAAPTLSAALADPDAQVRKAALDRIASQKDKIEAAVLDRALSLAVRDPDPELSQLALTTIARIAPKEAVQVRLHRSLASRVERERAQAAAAAIGLVERDATVTVDLLKPLLDDPSHDVRVAALPALAAGYAKTNTVEKLSDLLTDSENHAMQRLVAAGAFVILARTDNGRPAAEAALKKIDGPPMAHAMAKLVGGLIAGKSDGLAFLQELVP
ncbi:MAG: lyase domain protein repeat-containing protein [Myxococcales bacterium]|nr:lyase domain protein repeat-containing protein [Myxococcales bacterium]